MRGAYDAEQIRTAEKPLLAALPDGALMQRAATGLARRCVALLPAVYGARVVLLVGTGNNGGDALFAGARLAGRGARVHALLTGDRAHDGGLAALRAAGGSVHRAGDARAAELVAGADLVVDGILGIGGRGGLRAEQASVLGLLAEGSGPVVAVDVPSGVDASTGAVEGAAVRADVTVTFGALKAGLVVAPGADHAGLVEVVDIGLDLPEPTVRVPDAVDVADLLPDPAGETDKYRRGVLGVAAGSDAYTGAAVLVVGGAMAAGVGMVRYAGTAGPAGLVRSTWPEAVVTSVDAGDAAAVTGAGRVQAWVVGPGLGTDDAAAAIVQAVLATDVPVLVDADGITVVARHPQWLRARSAPTLLTPHAGEFARLVDGDRSDVQRHRLERVRAAAADFGVCVLLKGSTTLVAAPGGSVHVNPADTAYLATAGSGDVLSGICGALLAGGLDAADAGTAGAYLHGLAGLLAVGSPPASIVASDLIAAVPRAVRTVLG